MGRHQLLGVLIALCVAPFMSMAEGRPALHIDSFEGAIHVTVSNAGDQSIKVRNDFLLAPLVGALALEFKQGAASFPLVAQINPELPTEETYSILAPGQEIGQMFGYPIIRGLYSLKPGCYSVRAFYHDSVADKFGGIPRDLVSNVSSVCVVRVGKSFELRRPDRPAQSAEGH
jgi:hypothetical protein